jgi:hypothetical protein
MILSLTSHRFLNNQLQRYEKKFKFANYPQNNWIFLKFKGTMGSGAFAPNDGTHGCLHDGDGAVGGGNEPELLILPVLQPTHTQFQFQSFKMENQK